MDLASGIIITHQPDVVLKELELKKTRELFTIIRSEDDKGKPKEFLVEHAQEAISKAYIASENLNYIILIAPKFSDISQNRLLKILEEPPRNKAFIIISESKSALLDTIQSRLPIIVLNDNISEKPLSLDLENLNLAKVYEFSQENNHISSTECKVLVERISLQAMKSGQYNLDEATLKVFSDCIKALDVGSPVTFILNTLLLKLLAKKKR
ncbi:MAG: DNA poymerase III subunit delta [uncultured Sulfurovum sp.]|uniref:DNA poymerase III subunit delta n=1 Tax=uncultured Sulfurovum sp. TaxID=269237 RepID=A0A6S6SX09_9BACT|nr:MAG: DNA poymerase III subunit delta [uncultured Sulfurovum sp.]